MITLSRVSITAGSFRLTDLSFTVEAGAHAVLMGPSGSGKTTTLEAICGLRRIHAGTIQLNGCDITRLPPAARNIGFVPQDGALFPHLTVRENAAFALRVKRHDRTAAAARIAELSEELGLAALLDRPVAGLSGGERQRVALARALAARPPVLLLDEPLSALDADGRSQLRDMLTAVRRREGVTILHVTHDAGDADSLATQVIRFPLT